MSSLSSILNSLSLSSIFGSMHSVDALPASSNVMINRIESLGSGIDPSGSATNSVKMAINFATRFTPEMEKSFQVELVSPGKAAIRPQTKPVRIDNRIVTFTLPLSSLISGQTYQFNTSFTTANNKGGTRILPYRISWTFSDGQLHPKDAPVALHQSHHSKVLLVLFYYSLGSLAILVLAELFFNFKSTPSARAASHSASHPDGDDDPNHPAHPDTVQQALIALYDSTSSEENQRQ